MPSPRLLNLHDIQLQVNDFSSQDELTEQKLESFATEVKTPEESGTKLKAS